MMKNKMKKIIYIFIGLLVVLGTVSTFDYKNVNAQGVINTGDLNNQKFCDGQLCTVVYDAPGNDGKTHTYRLEFDNKGTPNDDSDDTLRSIQVDGTKQPYYAYRDSPTKQGPKQGSTEFDFLVNSYVGGGTSKFYSNNSVYDTTKTVFKDPGAKTSGPQLTKCIVTNSYGLPVDFNFSSCVATIFNQVVLRIAAMFLWVAAWFFNFTLSYSLNMGNFLQTVPIVDIGWKVFRDVANLCFIFILLYIAINTILQASVANSKKLLGTVIIVAVLLNFSLFFTKVVIDSSNILALQFYEKMGGEQTPSISSFINKNMKSGGDKGIAQTFMKGLGLSGIYNAGKSQEGADKEFQAGAWTTVGNVLAVSIGGAILITVTAFVFFAAAFMFLIRTVVLIFIMVLAPLAFLSLALPKSSLWSKWSGMLISQSFFAPIYMMFIYLVVAIITGEFGSGVDDLGGKMNIATFLTGNGSAVGTLYVFVVLIAMMLGSLFMAKSMGAVGGDLARNAAGKVTFGAGAWMSRQTIGRGAKAMQESGWVKNMAGSKRFGVGFVGRQLEKRSKSVSEGSFDMRGTALAGAAGGMVGGFGDAGGKGGYSKSFKDSQKAWEDQAKRVGSKSETEQRDIEKAEEDKRLAQATQADLLLDEKEKAERKIVDDGLLEKKIDAEQKIASLESFKATQIQVLNDEEINARREYKQKFDAWQAETDVTRKHALEVEKEAAENRANNAVVMKEKANIKYDEAIGGHKRTVADYDRQASIITNSKKALSGINENYKEDGTDEENAEITKSLRDKAKAKDVLQYKTGLVTKAASAGKAFDTTYIGNHIKEEINTRAKRINDAAKKRGEGVLEEDGLLTRVLSPGRIAAYRNYQKDGKKNKAEKAQDALNEILKAAKEEEEKKKSGN
jgi:hypothetical protein